MYTHLVGLPVLVCSLCVWTSMSWRSSFHVLSEVLNWICPSSKLCSWTIHPDRQHPTPQASWRTPRAGELFLDVKTFLWLMNSYTNRLLNGVSQVAQERLPDLNNWSECTDNPIRIPACVCIDRTEICVCMCVCSPLLQPSIARMRNCVSSFTKTWTSPWKQLRKELKRLKVYLELNVK